MGIEIQATPFGVRPGQTATFTFQNQVEDFVLGISAFSLTYGPKVDHWVHDFSIKMLSGQTMRAAVSGNVVTAQVQATLQDSSGHTVDPGDSIIYPVCVAVTGTADPLTTMATGYGIANGSSAPVSLGSSSFTYLTSFLAGFALDYPVGRNDHQVFEANAGCSITSNQSQGSIFSSAALSDADGNQVTTATVDAGVIAAAEARPGFFMQPVPAQQTFGPVPVPFPSGTSISQAFILLQSWKVQYPHVHNVKVIGAGSFGTLSVSNGVVTLPNMYATIGDNSGHWQDNSNSSASAWVIALP